VAGNHYRDKGAHGFILGGIFEKRHVTSHLGSKAYTTEPFAKSRIMRGSVYDHANGVI